jgi:hypothetical protein
MLVTIRQIVDSDTPQFVPYENRFDILANIPRPLKLVLQELRRFGVLVYLEDFKAGIVLKC